LAKHLFGNPSLQTWTWKYEDLHFKGMLKFYHMHLKHSGYSWSSES